MTTPQTVSRYEIGDLVRVVATFVGTDGITVADPATVNVLVKNGYGSVATWGYGSGSVMKIGTGAYACDLLVDTPLQWYYRFVGAGGVQAAEEWTFIVDPSHIL